MAKEYEVGGVIYEFPDEYTDQQVQDILTKQGVIKSILQPAGQAGKPSAVSRAASGFWEQINPVAAAKGLAEAVAHPLDTAANIGRAQDVPRQRTVESFKSGDLPGTVRHALGYALPILGPQIDELGNQAERGDVAGSVGGSVGMAATLGLPRIFKAFSSIAPPAAEALKASAQKNYLSVLLPGSKRVVPKAEQIAAGLAEERPVALTRGQLMKRAEVEKSAIGPQAATAYAGTPPMSAAKAQPIFDAIEEMRNKHVRVKGSTVQVNEPLAKALDRLEDNIRGMRDSLGNIPAETLDDFRDKLFRGVVDATGNVRQAAPAAAKRIETGVANSIRRVLDSEHPDAKAINDSYHLWAKAYEFMEDARKREIAAKSGIVTGSATGFGALAQKVLPRPVRGMPTAIANAFDSTAWNTISGATKQKVAEAMSKGDWKAVGTLIRTVTIAGQTVERGREQSPFSDIPADLQARISSLEATAAPIALQDRSGNTRTYSALLDGTIDLKITNANGENIGHFKMSPEGKVQKFRGPTAAEWQPKPKSIFSNLANLGQP